MILCFFCASCTMLKSMKDIEKSIKTTVIVGRISASTRDSGPIIVAACSGNDRKQVRQYTVLHESGEYELAVDQGNYYIIAFRDEISNLIYDPGEPVGHYGDPTLVYAPAVGVVFDINIVISDKISETFLPFETEISSVKPRTLYSRQAGEIVNLDDELFSPE